MSASAVAPANIFSAIYSFNDDMEQIWPASSPYSPTDGLEPIAPGGVILLVDTSGSMRCIEKDLVALVGSILSNSNVDIKDDTTKFSIPPLNGGTSMIKAIQHLVEQGLSESCQVIVLTDGEETGWFGKLPIAKGEGIDAAPVMSDVLDFGGRYGHDPATAQKHNTALADYMQFLGVTFMVLSVGCGADSMMASMLGRKNVFLATIHAGSVAEDMMQTVTTLRTQAARKDRRIQDAIICVDPTRKRVRGPEQEAKLKALIGNIVVEGSVYVASVDVDSVDAIDASNTVEALEKELDSVLVSCLLHPNTDASLNNYVKELKGHLLFLMRMMCDTPTATIVVSGMSGITKLPSGIAPSSYRKFLNMATQQMSVSKNRPRSPHTEVLKSEGKSPVGGSFVVFEGDSYKIPSTCAMYSCKYASSVVDALICKDGYSVACEKLPLKSPKRSKRADHDASVEGTPKRPKNDTSP